MRKTIVLAVTLSAMLLQSVSAFASTKIVIGRLDWPGAEVISAVLKEVMTKYLDAKVSEISAAEAALYEAMNKGDQSVDIVPDMWTDHLAEQMQKYVYPGSRETILLNKTPYLGTEGIFIPEYVAEKYHIQKLSDLADPKNAAIFNIKNTKKPDLWIGDEAWESTNRNMARMKSYGVTPNFNLTTVNTAAFLASLKSAYERQQPIVFYYWTPEIIFAKYKLVRLQEPDFTGFTTDDVKGTERYNSNGCYTFYQPASRPDWLEASSVTCAEPPTRVHVAYARELAERAPKIATFLSQIDFTDAPISEWIRQVSEEGKTPDAVASAWIAEHRDEVEAKWLAGTK